MLAYHFCGNTLRDGRPIPADGEWLQHDGPVTICKSGLHASDHPFDALQYSPGATLCLVECEDVVHEQGDKLVCRRRKIIARFDATELLRAFARQCAIDVIHLWNAPVAVRRYLETGDESLMAAAWDAASDAAMAAAGTQCGPQRGTQRGPQCGPQRGTQRGTHKNPSLPIWSTPNSRRWAMRDFADKHYLHPESHAHKLAQALKRMGRKLSTHPASTYQHQPEPRVLTAWQRKCELRRMARAKR